MYSVHRKVRPVAKNALAPQVPGIRSLAEPLRKSRRQNDPTPQADARGNNLSAQDSGSGFVRRSREALATSGRLHHEAKTLTGRLVHGHTTAQLSALMNMSLLNFGEESNAMGHDLRPMQGLTAIAEAGDIVMVVDTFTWRHQSKADVASIIPSDHVAGHYVLSTCVTCLEESLTTLGLWYEAAPQKSGKLLFRLREGTENEVATASVQASMARTRHYAACHRAGVGGAGATTHATTDAMSIESRAAKEHECEFKGHRVGRRTDKEHSKYVLTFPLPIPVNLTPFECVTCRNLRQPGRYFPVTEADLRSQLPDVYLHQTPRKGD